jgi:hypothetical protein
MLADRTSLVPNACEPTESVRVAVQRDDAQEVAARSPEDPAVEPPAELDRPILGSGNYPWESRRRAAHRPTVDRRG